MARRFPVPVLLAALPLCALLVLPLLALLGAAPWASLMATLQSVHLLDALRVSLWTSATATALAVAFGLPLAYLVARHPFPGKRAVDILIDLPMVLPPAVAGIALLLTVGRRGLLGPALAALGWQVAFSPAAVILAQLFVAAPYFVRTAAVGFALVDPDLEQAAALDGGNGWQVWRHVTLPLTARSLAAGALMSWARALGEFGATVIVAGNLPGWTQTMPLAIYVGFEMDLSVALVLSLVLLGLSAVILGAIRGWLGVTLPRPFR